MTALPDLIARVEAAECLVTVIAREAVRYAAFYPESSDGRNTFLLFADFVETRAVSEAAALRARMETPS